MNNDEQNKSQSDEIGLDDLTLFYYDDVITNADCDVLVQHFTKLPQKPAYINKGTTIDAEIRNVNRIPLPVHTGIGAILTGVGIDANFQRWKFDVTRSNQCEFLRYPVGGQYRGHIDTVLSNLPHHATECRKLTILAFLNDDFVGGKFFLNIGPELIYPPQSKGTVLVFPSFLHHGVEDVIEGERYSAVTWLVGPWFR